MRKLLAPAALGLVFVACADDAGDTYDAVDTLGTVSTMTFVVGSLALSAGLLLLVTGGSQEPVQTALAVGPGWAGVKGRF